MSPSFCGIRSFKLQKLDDQEFNCSPSATPRKSKKSSKKSKNPYASRGLDKFSALLTELGEKRQKIYSKLGSEEKTLIRFVYSSSNDCIPIVVKLKDQKREKTMIGDIKEKPFKKKTENVENKLSAEKLGGGGGDQKEIKQQQPRLETVHKSSCKLQEWRRPYYYMPVAIILILVFLIFGKTYAILCTSLGWYMVPALCPKTTMEKKQQVKIRWREPKVTTECSSSPKNHKSPQEQEQHTQKKMIDDSLPFFNLFCW